MADFTQKSVAYSLNTAEILDLAGEGNIFFSRGEGKDWRYQLIDGLYPASYPQHKKIDEAKEIINKVGKGVPLEPWEQNSLMNTINYVRVINGLAHFLKIPERINIIPEGVKVSGDQILAAIKG